jgi:MOSC domain-containing protein YiiM
MPIEESNHKLNREENVGEQGLNMKVLSINVSLPRKVVIDGIEDQTGIFKTPVTGPVGVKFLNLAGDGQADLTVHGGPDKAVYAYPFEHLDFWKEEIQRNDLGPGSFGENLTVQGMAETGVAIGDEFEIGSARFVVTQPRLPCYKLAFKFDLPWIGKPFMESGRTGFYLRVLREGTIEAGDEIRAIPSHERGRVTISEFLDVFKSRQATRGQMIRIVNLEALPLSWKDSLLKRVEIKEEN